MHKAMSDDPVGVSALTVTDHLRARLASMHPAYFAMAMATGIVAIGSDLLGLRAFAITLSAINLVVYPVLWILLLARVVLFPRQVIADWTSHQRAPGFFTVVAATGVVGSQMALLHGNLAAATMLWWVTVVLWGLCTYGIFAVLTVREEKPSLAEGINGGWLVAIVATQSVVVLGCSIGARMLGDGEISLFMLFSFWLAGGMLYFWTISLIFYRYLFFRFSPNDLMPPYWINMGAVAISTLAGVLLIRAARGSALLGPLTPFITGMTIMFWATATWWIPMLLLLGIWRHGIRGLAITYDPLYWGLVFPLGMYAVCTFHLSDVLAAPFLVNVARVFIVAASAAWLLTFLGVARRMLFPLVLALHMASSAGTRHQHTTEPLQTGGSTS
jgi:tellurite resistance protein TehA-like permease